MKKSFLSLVFEAVLFQGLTALLGLAWVSISAHQLDAASLGVVLVTLNGANTLIVLCGMGLQHAVSVKAATLSAASVVTHGLVAIALAAAVATLGAGLLWAVVGSTVVPAFGIALVPSLFVYVYATALVRALHCFRAANFLMLGQAVALNALLVGAWSHDMIFSAALVLACLIASNLVFALVAVISALTLGGFDARGMSAAVVRELMRFGGQAQVGNVLKEVMYRADLYLVSWLLGSAAAGLYAVVLKVIEGLGRFVDATGLVLLPLIARFSTHERNRLTGSVTSVALPVSLLMALVIAASSGWVLRVFFGEPYVAASGLLVVGIFALTPLAIWKILANDVIGRGLLREYAASALVGAMLIVLGNGALLGVWGLQAAPWVLVSSYLAAAVVLMGLVIRRLKLSLRALFIPGSESKS